MENENTQVSTEANVSPKSRLVALLLGIFLGGFGAHQFYLGRIARGVVHIVLYVIGLALYISGLVSVSLKAATIEEFSIGGVAMLAIGLIMLLIPGIWSLISWIMIAVGCSKDSNGLIVRKWLD